MSATRVEARVKAVDERYDRQIDKAREAARLAIAKLRRDRAEKIKAIRAASKADHLSDEGAEFIASWEGLRLTAYRATPSERYLTIGYGHYGPDVRAGMTITKERALELMRADASEAVEAVLALVKVKLSQAQADCLISFVFNVGTGAFGTSTLLRRLNEGDYDAVPSELLRWVNAGGVPVAGLVNRRRAEAALWRSGS